MAQLQICRTCLEVIRKPSMFVTLDGSGAKSKEIKSKLEACVPEMTINTVKNPVICSRCLISLNASYEFKRKCIATEEEIYNYLFNTDLDELDLQLIANQCPIDKSYSFKTELNIENIKQEIQTVATCKTEEDEIDFEVEKTEDYKNFLLSNVKDETRDSYFEATDNKLFPVDSQEFSTIEELIPSESQGEKTSIEQSDNQTTLLPNCSVTLTRLSDDLLKTLPLTNIEVDQNLSEQNSMTCFKINRKRTYRNYAERNDVCYVCYPYNSNTAEPIRIKKRSKLDDEKCYRCGLCGYSSSLNLKVHMRIHTGEKPNKCNICGFATAYASHLKKHMKIHSKNESHDCAYCVFSTDSEIGLKDHMNIHPGCTMYKCSECEYATDNLRNHKYHELSHTHKQIYECATCEFKTDRKSYLILHIKVHSAEKPYRCSECSFTTAYHSSLNAHLKMHTVKYNMSNNFM